MKHRRSLCSSKAKEKENKKRKVMEKTCPCESFRMGYFQHITTTGEREGEGDEGVMPLRGARF